MKNNAKHRTGKHKTGKHRLAAQRAIRTATSTKSFPVATLALGAIAVAGSAAFTAPSSPSNPLIKGSLTETVEPVALLGNLLTPLKALTTVVTSTTSAVTTAAPVLAPVVDP